MSQQPAADSHATITPSAPTLWHWRDAWRDLGATADDALFTTICAHYSEPHRHYHTLQHLAECLSNVAALRSATEHYAEVVMALWFHDAIYQVREPANSADNELQSAEWARGYIAIAGLHDDIGARVHALILATRHDAVATNADARALLDVDLWILGAPAARFDEYEAQVRLEYGHVPEPAFRSSRTQVLMTFLARDHIFNTPLFRDQFEHTARTNLARSLAQLNR